jgi:uncharacterized protein
MFLRLDPKWADSISPHTGPKYQSVAGAVPATDFQNSLHPGDQTMASSNQGNQGGSSHRGFAGMDPERQREIASEGGKAAHEKGTAHEFSPEEAREAGSKGGQAAHEKGTAHEFDSQEAREAGRKGGQAAHQKGTAHEFDSEQAREAGRKGGQASRGGGNQGGQR